MRRSSTRRFLPVCATRWGFCGDWAGENAALSQLDAELEQAPSTLRAAFALLERAVEQAAQISAALANREEELESLGANSAAELRGAFGGIALPRALVGGARTSRRLYAPRKISRNKLAQLDGAPSLARNLDVGSNALSAARRTDSGSLHGRSALREASDRARERVLALETLARQCDELAAMDFTFLFDPARDLFSIGFNVTERRRDASFYDLLASEARLCSYVAIAQGQVPQDHWFSLGRLLVASRGEPILVSWSGSMFEYLMPLLVMPNYENTLLDHTCKAAVRQQIEYGQARGVPWGISESGYNRTDVQLNYQYRAFGVPGLGLKRGLAEDLVIAPYASAMALMVAPREACENLQRLAAEGREGAYGFYEAVDYTPSRLPPDESSVTVRSFMAHHQGMSLLALVYLLRDLPMQRRFLSRPLLKAADLLLQERVPKTEANVLPGRSGPGGIAAGARRRRRRHARLHQSHVRARRRFTSCPTVATMS